MAVISGAECTTLCDAIADHIATMQTVPQSSVITTLTTGQATTKAHVAGLNDAQKVGDLINGFINAMAAEGALLASWQRYNDLLDAMKSACYVLEAHTGGLPAFLAANTLQVDPRFCDAYNRMALAYGLPPMPPRLAFGPASQQLASILVTGTGAGTFSAGTPIASTYGNTKVVLKNIGGGPTGGASATYTLTYQFLDGSGNVQSTTTAATVGAGTASGATVAVTPAMIAVIGITLTGGTNGDNIAVQSIQTRALAF